MTLVCSPHDSSASDHTGLHVENDLFALAGECTRDPGGWIWVRLSSLYKALVLHCIYTKNHHMLDMITLCLASFETSVQTPTAMLE